MTQKKFYNFHLVDQYLDLDLDLDNYCIRYIEID